eukprot:gene16029-biopygen18757
MPRTATDQRRRNRAPGDPGDPRGSGGAVQAPKVPAAPAGREDAAATRNLRRPAGGGGFATCAFKGDRVCYASCAVRAGPASPSGPAGPAGPVRPADPAQPAVGGGGGLLDPREPG